MDTNLNIKTTTLILLMVSAFLIISCKPKEEAFNTNFETYSNSIRLEIKSIIHDSTDCGEWGGHEEWITISKGNNELIINYHRFGNHCREVPGYQSTENIKMDYSGKLNPVKEKIVQNFIFELTHRPRNRYFDSYEVRLVNDSIFSGFTIWDPGENLKKYENFRDKLISE